MDRVVTADSRDINGVRAHPLCSYLNACDAELPFDDESSKARLALHLPPMKLLPEY